MSEQNNDNIEPSEQEWEAPPIPEQIQADEKEEAEMSEVATVANVFFEPGRTFEDLRKKPRFIIAFVILAVLATAFVFAFQTKIGEDQMRRFMRTQQEQSAQMQAATEEQKQQAVDIGMTIQKVVMFAFPVFMAIGFLIGGLIYWAGMKAMGGTAKFTHGLSVFVYSSLPPGVVSTVANFIILFMKPAEEIDIATSQRGLVNANPTLFFGGKETPVLTTIISSLDLFVIWGMILAAIGLRKVSGISKGSSWAIVLILFLLGLAFRVISAFINGMPS
ncbi:MAG: YIP1 family protein [Acidobacteriota bacterium]|nr:MAG: YIP1 family protein [Acidobacteriota bacterium]